MPELKFAKPKEPKTSDGKISARTRNEPQRRNGVVLEVNLNGDTRRNEIDMRPVPRPNKKMTPELKADLQAKIIEVNDIIRARRRLEEQVIEMNAKFIRGLKEIMDLGPFDPKELEDLSHEAFKNLRLYR